MALDAGHARICISPEDSVYLLGFQNRKEKSLGVHDDLFVNAIAFSDGDSQALLLTYDLCMISEPEIDVLKEAAGKRTGLSKERIAINCSHTHSAPHVNSRTGDAPPAFEREYFEALVRRTASVAEQALADLKPATLETGKSALDIGQNRREMQPDGTVKLGQNPKGPRLGEVTVWRLVREEAPDIVLWSAANHGTTLSGDNLHISSEWMGDAVRKIEASSQDLRAVFVQGCCGDQNVYRTKGEKSSFEKVAEHGTSASEAVLQALQSIQPVKATPVRSLTREARLPTQDGGTGTCQLFGLRLGDAVLLGIGGEPFVEYALFGRSHSKAASTIVLGYTDGYASYIPTAQACSEGGYELKSYVKQKGLKPWSSEVEQSLKAQLEDVLKELGALKDPE